ncbi:MAG: tryptophan-rich sensory protein [Fimbriimonas sp.]|nr:tryptophan-rich sensory protein [Fimbriimonas sp.]
MRINEDTPNEGSLRPTILLLSWLTFCYAICFVGYQGRMQGLWFWYVALRRPDWDVPTWLLTPAWTILFGLIGASLWNLFREGPSRPRFVAILLLIVQLILSALEPWIYFAWHRMPVSLAMNTASCLIVLLAMVFSLKARPLSAKLMIPYLGWIVYGSILEFAVMRLNA